MRSDPFVQGASGRGDGPASGRRAAPPPRAPAAVSTQLAAAAPVRRALALTIALLFAAALTVAAGAAEVAAGSPSAAPGALAAALEAQRTGDLAQAWQLATGAIEATTGDRRPAYLRLARIARQAGRLDDLEDFLHERLRRGRDVSIAEWTLGRSQMWRGRFAPALTHLERAVVLDPGRLESYIDLADCRLALDDDSLEWLDHLRGRVGHNWAESAARGYVLLETGHPHEAADLLAAALRFQPGSTTAYRLLGRAHARLGRSGDARADLEQAAALAAATPAADRRARLEITVELERAALEERLGHDDQALRRLEAAGGRAEEILDRAAQARALAQQGRILAMQSRLDEARKRLRAAASWTRGNDDGTARRLTLLAWADVELASFETRPAMERLRTILGLAAASGDERFIESALQRLGDASLARGEYLESLPYFAEASERATDAGATMVQQDALVGAAQARLMLAEHRRALEMAKLALALAERLAYARGQCNAHLVAGRACFRLGLFDRAEDHLTRALDLAERSGFGRQRGRAFLHLGRVFDALGQSEMAQDWFRQARAVAARLGDRALEVDCETQIAEGVFELGDYDEALDRFGRALELATEAGYLEGRWSNLTSTGEVYKHLGDHGRAASYFREALRLGKKTGNRVSQAENLEHLGEIYTLFGDYRHALAHLERAIHTSRETGSVAGEGSALLAICQTQNASGRFTAARLRCSQALTHAERTGDLARRTRASVELGNALLGLGEPEQAQPYFESARQLAAQLERPVLEWPALEGLSRALADQGRTELATQMARQAVETVERLRGELDRPEDRAGFLEDRLQPYEQLVTLLIQQGMLPEAFQVMEYSRSRTFLELLGNETAMSNDPQVARLRRQEMALGREISRTTERLARLPAVADRDSTAASILHTLRELRQRLDEIRWLIGPRMPTAEVLTGARPLALAQVQEQLRSDEVILEYYVTRRDLITFLITRDQVRAITTGETEPHLAARVKLLRSTLSEQPRDRQRTEEPAWRRPAAALYQVLLGPLRADPLLTGKTDLIIIPHKFLHYVPFQALLDHPSRGARFLVEDFVISYAPSASVLGHCYGRDRDRHLTALALANPRPADLEGAELPYVRNEVIAMQRSFGAQASVRIGAEATETAAKQQAPFKDIIHIATHYAIDRRNPLHSALDLAPSPVDDGRLQVQEVMDMQLEASLVVLSGCFTAFGSGQVADLPDSDDWVSLTRAFIYAGAPSVVATLWPINDRSTASFMARFYDLLPFHTKGEAVSLAQRELLASATDEGDFRDPYYWAPFVMIGSAR